MDEPRGFTLLELLVGFAIAALLLGLGVPAFSDLIRDSRRTAVVNAFVHSVHLAKSAAIMRARYVTLCKSADARTCSGEGATWGDGWIVFVDPDRDRQVDPDEAILHIREPYRHGSITGNRKAFTFHPYVKRSTAGTLVFCDPRGPAQARAVIVSYTGRPRIASRDARRNPLECRA